MYLFLKILTLGAGKAHLHNSVPSIIYMFKFLHGLFCGRLSFHSTYVQLLQPWNLIRLLF